MTHRYRSAKTGAFVSKKYAFRHPKTTVSERVKKRSRAKRRVPPARANGHRFGR